MSDQDPAAKTATVQRRDDQFAQRMSTKIWEEVPQEENPYIATSARCHGYDLHELMQKRSFFDVLYLLFRGELPSREQAALLEKLGIACINPGPRHPATRAAMNAGVGKTDLQQILPIGLMILGGDHLGAGEIEPSMRWLRKHFRKAPAEVAQSLLSRLDADREGDQHLCPGFGSRFTGIDVLAQRSARELCAMPAAGEIMKWADAFAAELASRNMGWLTTGLAAAVFADLGFQPKMGPGMFQLLSAPGLLAHGVEMASKPLTAMPFPDDKDYFFEFGDEHEQGK